MNLDEFFSGLELDNLKKITSTKYCDDNSDNCLKCKVGELDELLNNMKIVLGQARYKKCSSVSEAVWDENLKLAKVNKISKNLTKNFAHSVNNSMYLYPEECLCLLEMKLLVLKWHERKLSIQNAYDLILSTGSCTFKQFRTFSYLVKLGFRVFRHNDKLKGYKKKLTILPDVNTTLSIKKKRLERKPEKKSQYPKAKNKVSFPNVESGWVTLSRVPEYLLPCNLQPNYDVYTFNITVSSGTPKITEAISSYETADYRKRPFSQKPPIVYDSAPTRLYPVFEKNIPSTKRSIKEYDSQPKVKRLKWTVTEEKNMTNGINNEENMEIEEYVKPVSIDMIDATLSDDCDFHTSNNKINLTNNVHDFSNNAKLTLDSILNSCIGGEDPNSERPVASSSDAIFVKEKKFDIPSHIKQKLFAIKPTNIQKKLTDVDNKYRVHYDVYYPDNNVPKSSRSAPDLRVIVFEDELDAFPDVYNVILSSPTDNINTLWSIVNSSTVSFYDITNLVLPKSTDWEVQNKNDLL